MSSTTIHLSPLLHEIATVIPTSPNPTNSLSSQLQSTISLEEALSLTQSTFKADFALNPHHQANFNRHVGSDTKYKLDKTSNDRLKLEVDVPLAVGRHDSQNVEGLVTGFAGKSLFDKLALEIWRVIAVEIIDLQSLVHLRIMGRGLRRAIDGLVDWGVVVKHGASALRAMLATETAKYVTLKRIYELLQTKRCVLWRLRPVVVPSHYVEEVSGLCVKRCEDQSSNDLGLCKDVLLHSGRSLGVCRYNHDEDVTD
jgi:hypothetical protein